MRERTKKAALSILDTDYILDKALVEILSLKNYENVLDFGAGSSPYRSYIKHTNYTTADVAQNKNFKIDVIIEPNKKIPLNDDSYDLILLTDVIEHLSSPVHCLDTINQSLVINGDLIIKYASFKAPAENFFLDDDGFGLISEDFFNCKRVDKLF